MTDTQMADLGGSPVPPQVREGATEAQTRADIRTECFVPDDKEGVRQGQDPCPGREARSLPRRRLARCVGHKFSQVVGEGRSHVQWGAGGALEGEPKPAGVQDKLLKGPSIWVRTDHSCWI